MKTISKTSFKVAFLLQSLIIISAALKAQTYTTIANGLWSSPGTWQSGLVPVTGTIPATAVININHTVLYTSTNLENNGTIKIVNTTGINPQLLMPTSCDFKNNATGMLYIKDGLYTQYRYLGGGNTGVKLSGNFKNLGGRVQIINSIVEVAQDWDNGSGISSFTNGSLTVGQSYLTASSTIDSLSGVSVSLGWHGNGEFKAHNSTNYFQNSRIQLAGASGGFKVDGTTSISGDIDYITFKNHVTNVISNGKIEFTNTVNVVGSLNLDAYCTASASNYDPQGKFSGTQTPNCSLNYFPVNYTIASTAVLSNGLQFMNPVLIAGTHLQQGAVYSFQAVVAGIDATVTIDSLINGATISKIDDNGATIGYSNAFQPAIKSGNVIGRSYAVFTFKFYQAYTSSPMLLNMAKASALDIDGNSTLKEYADIKMGPGTSAIYMSNTSDISISALNATTVRGENILGIERSGIDTASYSNMMIATNQNISSFSVSYGTITSAPSTDTRQFSLYMKNFTIPNQTALPVKYRSFNVVTNNNISTLNWITETEINNSHFEIERSTDGLNFKMIGQTASKVSASEVSKTYEYVDNDRLLDNVNVVYYRLKQMDYDGRYTYSNVLVVRLQSLNGVQIQVLPNPFAESLSIHFQSKVNTTAQLQIVNTQGQLMLVQNAGIAKGNNSIQVTGLAKLAPGIYIARLFANGTVAATQKIIKN